MKAKHFKLLTLLSIFIAFSFNAQLSIERKKFIQKKSRWILPKNSKLSTTLAVKLTKDFKDDASKSYAISYWIAKKVKYDYKAFLTNTLSRHSSKEVLKRRRALCSEYADLFNEMAEAVGLKSETINGYVHPFDFFPGDTLYRAEHAWSTVKINNQWELMDITWGAGYVEEKKQLIKKAMWLLFEKPYEVEFRYVHKYNPLWFNVNPSTMVSTHLPTLDFFQFLKQPVSITSFENKLIDIVDDNESLVIDNSTSSKLKEYLMMGKMKRLELENTISKRLAPNNNRVVGFNNYLLFEELFYKKYNSEKKQLVASNKIKEKLNSYRLIAIDNLEKSKVNNNQEFSHYESRSLAWLDTLTLVNKTLSKSIRKRKKENRSQISSLRIIDQKANSYQKATNRSEKRFNKFNLNASYRPRASRDNIVLANAHLILKDSLLVEIEKNEKSIDSLFAIYDLDKQDIIASTENQVTSIHNLNKRSLFKHNLQKKLDYTFIYFDDELVSKTWLKKSFNKASSLNHENLAVLLNDLSQFLVVLKSKIKTHENNTYAALKALKSAKKSSYTDLNEDNESELIIQDYKTRMIKFSKGYKKYFHIKTKVELLLNFSILNLNKTSKNLAKDIRLEKQRHINYMGYRKSIQNSENRNMNLLIRKLNKMEKYFEVKEPILVDKKPEEKKKRVLSNSYSEYGFPSGDENVPSSSINEEIIFVNLLNKARKEKGMSELEINQDLCRAARYHSFDMGEQNYFEHASYDRNESTGYLEKVCGTFARIYKFAKSYGENIAAGNATGERTYLQWYNSPGHYENMFNPKFKTIGVGYVKTEGSKYNHYWTTDFGY